jgi:hypothetical protein
MSTERWVIDDIDRPELRDEGFLKTGDAILVTPKDEGGVAIEVRRGELLLLELVGNRRIQGWFDWIEGFRFYPDEQRLYLVHVYPRVTGGTEWLEGFVERISLRGSATGEVRDTETWTAMKEPPIDPPDEA